jgi:hypothetical protein
MSVPSPAPHPPPHLLIPYAASASPASRDALRSLQLPNLARLLTRLSPGQRDTDPDDEAHPLAMPHERALARALGLPQAPGHVPWAAQALRDAGDPPGTDAWAWITPCHWQIGMDSVTLHDPAALRLDDAESRALRDAMAPYFHEDGIELRFDTPGRWLARGEIFRSLATASLDRVIGQNVNAWMTASHQARPLRRLQSEMQMLLYTHAVNDARAARGLPPVNAFWVSGAGALADAGPQPHPVMPLTLREAALREDWLAWAQAWQQIDANDCAALLAALDQTGHATLTLASERSAQTFEAMPRNLLTRLAARFQRAAPVAQLEALL